MKLVTVLLLVCSLILFACSTSVPTPSTGDTQTAVAQTQAARLSKALSATPSPTATPTSAPTLAAVPETGTESDTIATVIADPGPDFSSAGIFGVAHLENGYFLVTIEVPGGVEGRYYATVGVDSFQCMTLPDYPSRLYCTGVSSQIGQIVPLRVYEEGSTQAVLEVELGIPPVPLTPAEQARLSRDNQGGSGDPPPADAPPPYPYPYP
jgi:hypothetical protein